MPAVMHCQSELEADKWSAGFIPDEVLLSWFNDAYSTSGHLLTLYSLARGLKAQNILEVGFGRSSFVLMRAAAENHGYLCACDRRDFRYLLTAEERRVTTYVCKKVEAIWKGGYNGFDLAFLDYFSSKTCSRAFCADELHQCIARMRQNGVIAVHDTLQQYEGIHGAIAEILKRPDVEGVTLPFGYGLTLLRCLAPSSHGAICDSFRKKPEPQNS
jgi:predicted O-methyltransferase YrrM